MRYHFEEADTLKEMFQLREAVRTQFIRVEKTLIDKKEKLFKTTDISKWGGGASCFKDDKEMSDLKDKLMNDKALAFTYMLPKDTAEYEMKKEELYFLTNQCLGEVQRVSNDNGKIVRTHIRDMSQNMCNYINTVSIFKRIIVLLQNHVMWADFLSHFAELCAKDLELEQIVQQQQQYQDAHQ